MTSSFLVHQTPKAISSFLNPVIYVDKRIVVLNKPSGLVCQLNSGEQDHNESDVRSVLGYFASQVAHNPILERGW